MILSVIVRYCLLLSVIVCYSVIFCKYLSFQTEQRQYNIHYFKLRANALLTIIILNNGSHVAGK